MNKSILLTLTGSMLMASMAFGQASAQASVSSSATVTTPIIISATRPLAFGEVVAGTTDGTVVMSAAGARSHTGGATEILGSTSFSAGQVTVNGKPDAAFTLTYPATVDLSYSGHTMALDTFTNTPLTAGIAGGSVTVGLGGTLHVATSQAPGPYVGTYTVTATYN